ncbi:MAG: HEAT repeat domain-containing protein [Methanomassiliicoccaceae archaeon]|nr:HEAT repeat domain-containing protein [Methanomassiliicoccaceae archaeon]
MSVSRLGYLERFLGCVDMVMAGRRNAVSGDKWLVSNYEPSFYSVLSKHLRSPDPRVRADVVNLLAAVKERAALDIVRELRTNDKDAVRIACLGYLSALNENDTMIPDLFDILKHRNGDEFKRAAVRMSAVGRSEDVHRLRKIYGQVDGEMRDAVKETLNIIIGRDASLIERKELLLSVPVFPDERKFLSFLDSSITYLDIRYRDSVACKPHITQKTYSNVYGAIMKMRVRMFNEFDNLKHYGKDCGKMYDELIRLMEWASLDLSGKEAETAGSAVTKCPKCGEEMRSSGGIRMCVDCGIKKSL